MDFGSLPPEINSGRMYVGPGSGPLLAAATAWDTLAGELHTVASQYQSVVTALSTGPWLGPSSMAMTAAAAPYVEWTRSAAAQAEQTAGQAKAAAAAYEAAFAETVPPPVVAANRSVLMALVATNILGQNTSAIAATEAQYGEMWAQDTSAMLGYADSSSAATALTPFAAPAPNTDPDGSAAQANAVSQAMSATPATLSNLATPAAAAPAISLTPLQVLDLLADLSGIFLDPEIGSAGLIADSTLGATALPYDVNGYWIGVHTDQIVSGWAAIEDFHDRLVRPPLPFAGGNLGSGLSAGLGEASAVGGLSVPSGWTAAAQEIRLAAMSLPTTSVAAAAEAAGAAGAGSVFSQMALAGMAGGALARPLAATGGAAARERVGAAAKKSAKPETKPDEPVAAAPTPAGGPITSISAELRELASLRDSGILTEDEFTEQKRRLLAH